MNYAEPHILFIDDISQFGDGIMSMIDCKVTIDRKPDPKGDRVLLTFECVNITFSLDKRKTDVRRAAENSYRI